MRASPPWDWRAETSALQAGGQELLVAPGVGPGPLGEALHPGQQGGVLQLPAQVGELTGAAHAAPVARS